MLGGGGGLSGHEDGGESAGQAPPPPDIVEHQGQERATKDALKFVPKLPCHYFFKINIVVSFAVIK